MGFDTIIVNGRIVTATDTSLADVALADGKIALIGKDLPRENAARLIDAGGKYVFPGGIDVHTHDYRKTGIVDSKFGLAEFVAQMANGFCLGFMRSVHWISLDSPRVKKGDESVRPTGFLILSPLSEQRHQVGIAVEFYGDKPGQLTFGHAINAMEQRMQFVAKFCSDKFRHSPGECSTTLLKKLGGGW